MSASNEWFEYHLTPRGWELGSNKTDFGKEETKEPPPDRVLTNKISEFQSSTFSKMTRSEVTLWESADSAAIADLKARFGAKP